MGRGVASRDAAGRRPPLDFASVRAALEPVVSGTRIVMDHYRSTDRLDYDSGPVNVIAVGGNTLSRGLTLEGLVVSFFVRSSNVYDTLLQMGRWFGYRPGYEDLPRIFMPAETRRWFTHLATVEAEMRVEIDRYITEHLTPLDMAVRIRSHPKMKVTSPAKSKGAVRGAASYGGQLVETRYFPARRPPRTSGGTRTTRPRCRGCWPPRTVKAPSTRRPGPGGPCGAGSPWNTSSRSSTSTASIPRPSTPPATCSAGTSASGARPAVWSVGTWESSGRPAGGGLIGLPHGGAVDPVVRTRLDLGVSDPVADIKTLTGSRDEALDLDIPEGEEVNRSLLQRLRTSQQPERGLILLYPIDAKAPVPVRGAAGQERAVAGRAPLDAPGDIVWGAALVFPKPTGGVDLGVEYDYLQADLSRVFPTAGEDEDEDISVLEQDLDGGPEGAA